MASTSHQLTKRYSEQIRAEFEKTKTQVSQDTEVGREILLNHLHKLSAKVQGRSHMALHFEGRM